MENLKERIEIYKDKLENDPDYEMSDEMSEEYYALKQELEMSESSSLHREFNRLCREYENPDGIIEATLKDMYPETDGEFELDGWE